MSPSDQNGSATTTMDTNVEARADHLRAALDRGGDRLDADVVGRARQLVAQVGERTGHGERHTVVALAGATGSGKSSLFNVLVSDEVAQVDVRRPTTERPTAGIWGEAPAEGLLDWLDVDRRHHVTGAQTLRGDLSGLVLIDLPDVDSREGHHSDRADKILNRADVLLWVTDPQKYADARLHDGYLSRLRDHETVMIAVLNQVDRLPESAVDDVTADLGALISADGSGEVQVVTTSTRTGHGVDDLRDAIGAIVSRRSAAQERLTADIRSVSRELLDGVGETEASMTQRDDDLVDSLAHAAGVPVILDAVEKSHHAQALSRAGWPLTRWARGLRPDPLRRLRLGDDRAGSAGITPSDIRGFLGRSGLPAATPAARAAVDLALTRTQWRASEGLPSPWADSVAQAARPGDRVLGDALDHAVMAVPMRERPPRWWQVAAVAHVVFLVAAVVGVVWTAVLALSGTLYAPQVPRVTGVLLPVGLAVVGLGFGIILAIAVRWLARVSARRRRQRAADLFDWAIVEVAREQITDPISISLQDHAFTREELRAAGR